jgi:hypothetical protein
MSDYAEEGPDGDSVAPNHYAVHVHPKDGAALLKAQPNLTGLLADNLLELAQDTGFRLDDRPDVELVADDAVAPHTIWVLADHVPAVRHSTQAMVAASERAPGESHELPAAHLVIGGSRYVPLDRTVINIGRRRDNTIVLDNPRVSRQHCQLRFRFGQFVLYDLSSRGGTFVNDARVSECVLRPGDVISLAGTQLVYVVDEESTENKSTRGDTQVHLNRADLEGNDMP